jgi:hypothetical protein
MRGIQTDLFTKLEQSLLMTIEVPFGETTIEVLCEIYTTK